MEIHNKALEPVFRVITRKPSIKKWEIVLLMQNAAKEAGGIVVKVHKMIYIIDPNLIVRPTHD